MGKDEEFQGDAFNRKGRKGRKERALRGPGEIWDGEISEICFSGRVAERFFVAAIIATYRRKAELERLFLCLERQSVPLGAVVVADNGREEEIRTLVTEQNSRAGNGLGFESVYVEMPENEGCGPGLVAAIKSARENFGTKITHFWILDDDVVLGAEVLEKLLQVFGETGAGCVAPLLSDPKGKLWGFPEPAERPLRKLIRKIKTPAEALEKMGTRPRTFCWATGACLLFTAQAIEKSGLPREDFWMLGEDLEFSMRVGARDGGVFTCGVEVPHLPPEGKNKEHVDLWNRLKFCSLLQNLTYLTFHSPYSGPMWRYLPGNYRRFFRDYGWSLPVWRDVFSCFWAGAVLAEPAGKAWGKSLRKRWMESGTQALKL